VLESDLHQTEVIPWFDLGIPEEGRCQSIPDEQQE
jgi:hypothetical protein